MIGTIFQFGAEVVEVRIVNNNAFFRNSTSPNFVPIEHLKLAKHGVVKEFPDLIDNEDWQNIARIRFKEKVKSLNSEDERMKYIIQDLTKFGYKPLYMQKQGFRPVKFK